MPRKTSKKERTSKLSYLFALLPVIIFVGFVVLFLTMQQPPPNQTIPTTQTTTVKTSPTSYQAAPDFTLGIITSDGLTGEKFTLSSTRGKVVFMEFIMSWCSVCGKVAPTVKKLHDQYSARGVVFVTVAGKDARATEEETAKFLQEHEVTWTSVYDEKLEAFSLYSVRGTPTFVIIGRDGRIVNIIVGARTYEDLASEIEKALRE